MRVRRVRRGPGPLALIVECDPSLREGEVRFLARWGRISANSVLSPAAAPCGPGCRHDPDLAVRARWAEDDRVEEQDE